MRFALEFGLIPVFFLGGMIRLIRICYVYVNTVYAAATGNPFVGICK